MLITRVCNTTIILSNIQINPAKNLQDCKLRTSKFVRSARNSEKFYDGDYDCNGNHDHERAKNACQYGLDNEAEKTIGFQNPPSGFAIHHVLCFGTIVIHNSLSFNGLLFLVIFLVFFDVSYLFGICLDNEYDA